MLRKMSVRGLFDLMRILFNNLNYLNKNSAIDCRHLVIAHPQTLGYENCLEIMSKRKFTWVLALDSSFFCRASYNHYKKEYSPCFRCHSDGLKNVEEYGCDDFPVKQKNSSNFQIELMGLVKSGKAGFLAQNNIQADIISSHFGELTPVHIVGMEADFSINTIQNHKTINKLIVFHANQLRAKGLDWALSLAAYMPDYEFLFPFEKSSIQDFFFTPNMKFKAMTWNTGLKEAISEAEYVLCPSLWSAPIEGALVKSIIYGKKCLVVQNDTAFHQEDINMPVIRLPVNLKDAAESIRSKASDFEFVEKEVWLKQYLKKSKQFTLNIYNAVTLDKT
jgi:hypothetical protein